MQPQVVRFGKDQTRQRAKKQESRKTRNLVSKEDMKEAGTIKWFGDGKNYGFVIDADGLELFLHRSTVTLYGLREHQLSKNTQIRFKRTDPVPGGRPEVSALMLVV